MLLGFDVLHTEVSVPLFLAMAAMGMWDAQCLHKDKKTVIAESSAERHLIHDIAEARLEIAHLRQVADTLELQATKNTKPLPAYSPRPSRRAFPVYKFKSQK